MAALLANLPLLARADRACAVSPFIDGGGLSQVLKAGAADVSLLTDRPPPSGPLGLLVH